MVLPFLLGLDSAEKMKRQQSEAIVLRTKKATLRF